MSTTVSKQAVVRNLGERMSAKLIGQQDAIDKIVPCVKMFQAGLSPEGRPAGVFLLLGPTGSGKTRTVEVLADVLHTNERHVLRIDCGEFTADHEVAKLIGAPPGYLGHRETQARLTQAALGAIQSDQCGLSIVLFDEIEKAAPSLLRLLLGVLDKGVLRLGDNANVNFERSIVFLTSNLGADDMQKLMLRAYGLGGAMELPDISTSNMIAVGERAVKKHFSPEFINRIDHTIVYHGLTLESMARILDLEIEKLQHHIVNRLSTQGFAIEVSPDASGWLLSRGFSRAYGARNLKRLLQREIMQPISELFLTESIAPGGILSVSVQNDTLVLKPMAAAERLQVV